MPKLSEFPVGSGNRVKQALRRGEVVIGTFIATIRTPEIGPMLAAAGFDFVIVDMEATCLNIQTVGDIAVASRNSDLCTIVRVPSMEGHFMSRLLDGGAHGLLVPKVETREQVEDIIRATKYHPLGLRSFAPGRAGSNYVTTGIENIMTQANEETLIALLIETGQAIETVEELVSVEGVDVALIGPNDLSQDLGIPGEVRHPQIMQGIDRVIAACWRNNIAAGFSVGDVDSAREWLSKGVRFLVYSNDIRMIVDANRGSIEEIRRITALA